MPGRILTSSNAGSGAIIALNPDVTNVVNLSGNPFQTVNCVNEVSHQSLHPSATRDGRLVAFASSRDGSGKFRIFVMNADGTGLRQVTFAQTDTSSCTNNCFNGNVYSVVWSPDGTRLAFKGTRLAADNNTATTPNFHQVAGIINADGTGETTLAVLDSTEEVGGIDWSPDGRHIGAPLLGVGQPLRLILFDLQAGTSREILQSAAQTGGFNINPGGFRFSPDGQRLAYTTGHPQLVVTDLNGAELSRANVPTPLLTPLWWSAGAAIPTPDRLELIPTAVVLRAGGPRVQLQPTLFDAAGNAIARAATGWTCNIAVNIFVDHKGLLRADTHPFTTNGQVCATDGGKQACVSAFANPTTNKSDEPEFFASYQYFDFLNRTPDAPGLAFWTGNITECGSNPGCDQVKRVHVSAAFFLSIELQETGFLVHRLYKAAFGDLPGKPVPVRREEFLPDTLEIGEGVVVHQGDWQARLEQNKQDFVSAFVLRPRFTAAYPANMTAAEFVDKLNQNAGGPLDAAERSRLIGELGQTPGDAQKRASLLRSVAEDQTLKDAEFRRAFVLMQYFGYLRRNPDDQPDSDFSGYNFWLGKLNEFGGDFVRAEMVRAFIESTEYRRRFGQ
jgi:WD40 repeat protein